MKMAVVNSTQLNKSDTNIVYCYSVDSSKAIVTYDDSMDVLQLLEYEQLSDLLLTSEWKQPEDDIS